MTTSEREMGGHKSCVAAAFLVLPVALCAAAGEVRISDEWAAKGRASLDNGDIRVEFAKSDGAVRVFSCENNREVMMILPVGAGGKCAIRISSFRTTTSSKERAACRVEFKSVEGSLVGTFSLNKGGAIKIESERGLHGVRVAASMRYGILPSRYVDDCVYDGKDHPELDTLHIPSEHMFMGLVRGNDRIVVGAWPVAEKRTLCLLLDDNKGDDRGVEAFEVTLADTPVFLGVLCAKGIWQQVDPKAEWKGKDVAMDWVRPFRATWKGQFTEFGTRTTYWAFSKRKRFWRPGFSFYMVPFYFDGNKGMLHFSKQIPPTERVLIYALEGHEETPYGFLTANLSVEDQRSILDLDRFRSTYSLLTNPKGEIWNIACQGWQEMLKTTLKVGALRREVEFFRTHADDRVYPSKSADTQTMRYRAFIKKMSELLDGWILEHRRDAAAVAYFESMRKLVTQMQQEYKDRMGGRTVEECMELIHEWSEQMKVLAREPTVEVYPEMYGPLTDINNVLNRQHDLSRRMGSKIRGIFQTAAYGCVAEPKLVPYAKRIRDATREQLKYQDRDRVVTARQSKSLLPPE